MQIFNLLIFGIKKKGSEFLLYHLIAIVLFALLYWSADNYIMYKSINHGKPLPKWKTEAHSLNHWGWYSLNVQTAVGLPIIDSEGDSLIMIDFYDPIFNLLSYAQLLSILVIAAMLI